MNIRAGGKVEYLGTGNEMYTQREMARKYAKLLCEM